MSDKRKLVLKKGALTTGRPKNSFCPDNLANTICFADGMYEKEFLSRNGISPQRIEDLFLSESNIEVCLLLEEKIDSIGNEIRFHCSDARTQILYEMACFRILCQNFTRFFYDAFCEVLEIDSSVEIPDDYFETSIEFSHPINTIDLKTRSSLFSEHEYYSPQSLKNKKITYVNPRYPQNLELIDSKIRGNGFNAKLRVLFTIEPHSELLKFIQQSQIEVLNFERDRTFLPKEGDLEVVQKTMLKFLPEEHLGPGEVGYAIQAAHDSLIWIEKLDTESHVIFVDTNFIYACEFMALARTKSSYHPMFELLSPFNDQISEGVYRTTEIFGISGLFDRMPIKYSVDIPKVPESQKQFMSARKAILWLNQARATDGMVSSLMREIAANGAVDQVFIKLHPLSTSGVCTLLENESRIKFLDRLDDPELDEFDLLVLTESSTAALRFFEKNIGVISMKTEVDWAKWIRIGSENEMINTSFAQVHESIRRYFNDSDFRDTILEENRKLFDPYLPLSVAISSARSSARSSAPSSTVTSQLKMAEPPGIEPRTKL